MLTPTRSRTRCGICSTTRSSTRPTAGRLPAVERESNRVGDSRPRSRASAIPREEQRQIFGKFVRGVRAKADGIKGTGIGLAMVRSNRGRAPAADVQRRERSRAAGRHVHDPAAADVRDAASSRSAVIMARILIVEDEPDIALGLEDDLASKATRSEVVARRRCRGAARHASVVGRHPARRHAAEEGRLRRVPRTAAGRRGDADHHADRARPGSREGARPRARRRRLRHQAVQPARAARAHQGGAAARERRVRRVATGSATPKWTSRAAKFGAAGKPVDITAVEFKLLETFIRRRGRVLTREQLLEQVWGRDSATSPIASWTPTSCNLRRKIEPDPDVTALSRQRQRAWDTDSMAEISPNPHTRLASTSRALFTLSGRRHV